MLRVEGEPMDAEEAIRLACACGDDASTHSGGPCPPFDIKFHIHLFP